MPPSLCTMVKQSLRMAWPITGNRILIAITNFFSMWILARLGSNELAAGALIFVTQVTITVIMSSILFAISPMVSRAYGAGDYLKIGAVAQQGWFLSLLLTLPALILLWFCHPILSALGQTPNLITLAQQYFHVYIFAVIPMFFFMTNQMFAMGVGKQHLSFATTLLATLVLISTAYAFTFGKWGAPQLGVSGVALGAVVSNWVGLLFSSYFLLRHKFFIKFELFRWRLTKSWTYLAQLLATGWPIAVQIGGEIFSWFLTVMFIGWLGEVSLSTQQITNQFNILVLIPIMGFSQASSILIGQAAGAKQYDTVRQLGWVNMGIGAAFMLLVMIFYLAFPKLLISFYIDLANPENLPIVHLSILIFAFSAFMLLFDSVRNICTGALRGLYDNRYPMYLGLILTWLIGLPLGYFLAFPCHLGIIGFNISGVIGVFILCILLLLRWHQRSHHLLARAEAHDLATAMKMRS